VCRHGRNADDAATRPLSHHMRGAVLNRVKHAQELEIVSGRSRVIRRGSHIDANRIFKIFPLMLQKRDVPDDAGRRNASYVSPVGT